MRERADLTQEKLSERAGISTIYLQSIESGRRTNVSLRIADQIAKALGIELCELLDAKADVRNR